MIRIINKCKEKINMSNFVQLTEENMDREQYGTFPHALYRLEKYRQVLSNDSILLYGILKDRLNLSFMNDMRDRKGQVFIIASLECICEKLKVSTSTARKLVRELENADLLRIEKCEGYNASRRFYLGDVNRDEDIKVNKEDGQDSRDNEIDGSESDNEVGEESKDVDNKIDEENSSDNDNLSDNNGLSDDFNSEIYKDEEIKSSNSSDENCQKEKMKINSSGDENYHKEGVKSNTSKGGKLNPNKPDLNNPDINNPNINKDKPKAKESYKRNYNKNYSGKYNKSYKKNYHKGNYNNSVTDDNGRNDNSNYEYLKPFNFEDL